MPSSLSGRSGLAGCGEMKPPLLQLCNPRYLPTWIGLGVLRLLSLLPLPVLYRTGTVLGDLMQKVIPSRHHIAERNIRLCFPEKSSADVTAMVRENLRNTARMFLYTGFFWWASRARLDQAIRVSGSEVLDEALRDGRGVIILAPHFVGLELGGIYLSTGYQGVSVYQRSRNPVLDFFMLKSRQRFGAKLIERKSDMKRLVRAIRQGQSCYYLPDQDPGPRRAVFAPFFGIPTATWPVLGRLARLARAQVIPCTTCILADGKGLEMVFDPPLADFPTGNPAEDAARMNRAVESCVRRFPLQYFWVHKRFKTRPSGSPDLYT